MGRYFETQVKYLGPTIIALSTIMLWFGPRYCRIQFALVRNNPWRVHDASALKNMRPDKDRDQLSHSTVF